MFLQAILPFVGILIGLIVVHELGHFVAAKLTGVRVVEAGIGYPPFFENRFRRPRFGSAGACWACWTWPMTLGSSANILAVSIEIALDARSSFRESSMRIIPMAFLERISKPGCRVYTKKTDIPWIFSGLGIAILSTPKGVMTGQRARQLGVGGEILCKVW